MDSILDPIKIVLCGGNSVGKTTLLKRLVGMEYEDNYEHTTGINFVEFSMKLNNGTNMKVTLIEVSNDLLTSYQGKAILPRIVDGSEGSLIVVDSTSLISMKDSDAWLEYLTETVNSRNLKYLMVHKADRPKDLRVVTQRNLNLFVRHSDIIDWSYTVGHQLLGDVDYRRGSMHKQNCIEDIIKKLIMQIIHNRKNNLYKLLPVPMALSFVSWMTIDSKDIDKIDRLNI